MERGKWSLDALFDGAHDWCLAHLPVEPVRLGEAQREVHAIDTSTIARLRAGQRLALAGKGYCHRAGRAVRGNIVAALTRVVIIGGVRVGLVRRTRFGSSCQDAVACLFAALPPATGKRLMVVDAGIATKEQFAAATAQEALLGRLRLNTKLRCAPAPPSGKPGRPPVHGEVLHPGHDHPEVVPDVERTLPGEAGAIRLRRWSMLHYEEWPETILDVVRIDDPAYDIPLIVGSTARDLRLEEFWSGYQHRWPVETNFFVAQDTVASLRAADNCDGPLASRLHRINQSVSCTRTVFSTRRSTGLADTGAHVSHATPHLNSYRLSNRLRLWPRRHPVEQHVFQRPDVIRQARRHRRCTRPPGRVPEPCG